MNIFLALLIPFLGTSLGAAMVFLMKKDINDKVKKILLGFAAGVMIAASIWSLLLPSMEMVEDSSKSWIPAAVGFVFGMLFLLGLDSIIPHLHVSSKEPEGIVNKPLKKKTMMVLAVTLHNIPEGMTMGVIVAGMLANNAAITLASVLSLSIGLALQNFPEGAVVSMPLALEGNNKPRAFGLGVLSGIVEPIAAGITILISSLLIPILPYLLSFAAGAMIYVVVEELIPECQQGKHSNIGTIGVMLGFVVMMILDVVLG